MATVNRLLSLVTSRASRFGWRTAVLATTLMVAALFIGAIWELFPGGAHKQHLLAWILGALAVTLALLAIEHVSNREGLAESGLSHERLRMALVSGKSVAWDLDVATGRDLWFGDLQTMFGIPSESRSLQVGTFYQYVHPEDRSRVSQAVADAQDNRKPYHAEFRVVDESGKVRWVKASGEFYYGKKGEPVRMLGVAVDITESRGAHDALSKSEEKFSKAFRAGPVTMTLTSARDHRYLDVNETFEQITGWKRDEVIGRTPFDINIWVDPGERERLAELLIAHQSLRDYEVHYRCKDGSQGVGSASAEFIEIEGEPLILSAIVDITDRKRAEDALSRKEAELAEAQHSAQLGSWQWDPKSLQLHWSEELFRIHGFDPKLFSPSYEKLQRLFTRESWDRLRKTMEDAIQTGTVPEVDLEVVRPDGGRRWVSTRGYTVRDSTGEVVSLHGTTQDITERKMNEEALRAKEQDLAEAQRLAHVGSWEWDIDSGAIHWSEELYRIYGLDPTQPAPAFEDLPKLYTPQTWNRMQQAMAANSLPDMDMELIRPDGSKRWIHTTFDTTRDKAGVITKLRGVSQDITEDKQTRDQLRENQERMNAIVNSAMDAIVSVDEEQQILLFNTAAEKMFRCSAAEAIGAPLDRFIPAPFRPIHKTHPFQFGLTGSTDCGHFGSLYALRSNGEAFPIEASISETENSGKKLFTVIIRDITERLRAETTLRESEERFRRVVEHIGDALAVDDVGGRIVFANDRFLSLFGVQYKDADGILMENYVPREYFPEWQSRHERRMRGEQVPSHLECECVLHDSTKVWLEIEIVSIKNQEGKIVGSQKLLRDISARKRAEQALRESEERFRLVANSAPVMIWMSGPDKLCNYFNKPWLDFTGRPLQEELGHGWVKGVHPEDSGECLRRYVDAFDKRQVCELEYRLRRHDGEYRWLLDIGVPRFNADGSFAGYIGSSLDITERKLAEEAMSTIGRRLIEAHEEERTWIGRELHDDINQRLALLAVELDRLTQNASEEVGTQVRHAQERIMEIARDVQSLSHRLHSSKLEYLGLVKAATSFCRELSEQSSVKVHFKHANIPHTLPKELSLCLFRVLQEALQNATKYSGVRDFTVELYGTSESIELTVSDGGKGFEEQEAFTRHGLGLISMRERLQLVHGELSVKSRPGAGTTIYARVPVDSDEYRSLAG
jgi:PAS domain S-box-containing protein